jgi:branched-subunit amino acid ABC-type transport system permease component
MKQTDYSQSGQTLIEYGLLLALIPLAILTLFVPASLAYLYMRRARGADRRTAILVAFGVTLIIGLLNTYLSRSRGSDNCAKTRCCTQECDCCNEACGCCSENCKCEPTEESVVAEPV